MKKYTIARRITLLIPVALVIVGLVFHTGTGTLTSFGWEAIAAICPLGAVEAFLASWTLLPRGLVAFILFAVAVILLGKVFCAWLCPVPPLRKFFTIKNPFKKKESTTKLIETTDAPVIEDVDTPGLPASEALLAIAELETAEADDESAVEALTQDSPFKISIPKCNGEVKDSKACASGCKSCVEKRKKIDSRHLVLGGALLSTAIFGFPVFCIVCPVGLTFATIIALWRLVGFNEPSWSLLIFPVILIVELFVLKKWCFKFCPLGAVMSLLSIPNRLFRPRVNEKKCLRAQGNECSICVAVCEEGIDPHFSEGMHECTKCGICVEQCPTKAVSIPVFVGKPKKVEKPVLE